MAVSIVEVISNQTSADPGSLSVSFASPPAIGDVALAYVVFDDTVSDQSQVSMSGLGASWRLVKASVASTGQWLGIFEGISVDGVSSSVTATETYTGTISQFGMCVFLLRGAAGTSPFYGLTTGYSTNPPVLSVSPLAATDGVIGVWYEPSTTTPTVTTTPVSGWSSGSQLVNGRSLHWRYITAADTTTHTMDSNVGALYAVLGVSSQAGTARVGAAAVEVAAQSSSVERRVGMLGAEVAMAAIVDRRLGAVSVDTAVTSTDRRASSMHLEVLVQRRSFIGWGVPL